MRLTSYENFTAIELRAGVITKAENFERAIKPAYKIWADFGKEIGLKQTSAQITAKYNIDSLIDKKIIGCVNLPPKNIAGFNSEFLLVGFADKNGDISLASYDFEVEKGAKLC